MIKWLLGTPPNVGSVWVLRGQCPFDNTFIKRVVEVRDGWVKVRPTWCIANIYDRYERIRGFRFSYKELDGKDSEV